MHQNDDNDDDDTIDRELERVQQKIQKLQKDAPSMARRLRGLVRGTCTVWRRLKPRATGALGFAVALAFATAAVVASLREVVRSG
jgi:hypothetical protein